MNLTVMYVICCLAIHEHCYLGLEAPTSPPKYVIGIVDTNDPTSYIPAMSPDCADMILKRRSSVDTTTLTNPLTSIPFVHENR